MEKKTMTVNDLAKQLGVSLPKAYALTDSEGFPCIRLGKRKVVPVAAFDRWLEEQATKGA